MSLIIISLGYVLYSLSTIPVTRIKMMFKNSKLKLIIKFDSFTNFSMFSSATLEYIQQSLKLKISKKIIEKICKKPLKIKNDNNDIFFVICFDAKNTRSQSKTRKHIPYEGEIKLPYKSSEVPITQKRVLIDILIVDDIDFNIQILKRAISTLKDTCNCGKEHREYSVHTASSGKEAVSLVINQNSV